MWRKCLLKLVGVLSAVILVSYFSLLGTQFYKPLAPSSGDSGSPDSPEIEESSSYDSESHEEADTPKVDLATAFKARPRRNINNFINLQPIVDQWLRDYAAGNVAVEIYDVDYHTVAASYQANVQMRPRSLYKLFYTYDGYAQIDAGADDPNQIYLNGMSLGYCLDIMIRQSNNPCAEQMLENDPPRQARVAQLINGLGLAQTQPDGLLTSAHDVSRLLQHYYVHPEWSNNSWQRFRSSALNQAALYRRGLPSGFSQAVVYNKVGYGGTVYNDAALVEFAVNGAFRRYVMVVMTDGSSARTIAKLGSMLEAAILYAE